MFYIFLHLFAYIARHKKTKEVAKKVKKYAKKKTKPKQATKKAIKNNRKSATKHASKTKGGGKEKSKPTGKGKKLLPKNEAGKRDKFVTRFTRLKNKEDRRKKGNAITIFFRTKTFQNKIKELLALPEKVLDYYTIREKGFPFAAQTILTTKKGKDVFARASRFTANDFHVDSANTKQFALESMVNYQDNYIEYIEDSTTRSSDWVYNPKNIIAITIKFIYYTPKA